MAVAAIDAASASDAWKKEQEFWGKKVDTRYGRVTKEAQHFSLKQWASSLLTERDEVRSQLAVATPDEKPIIESELELLERDVVAKSPERILRDMQMRWSERETKQYKALQVIALLCFLYVVSMIIGCLFFCFYCIGSFAVVFWCEVLKIDISALQLEAPHLVSAQRRDASRLPMR